MPFVVSDLGTGRVLLCSEVLLQTSFLGYLLSKCGVCFSKLFSQTVTKKKGVRFSKGSFSQENKVKLRISE